MNIHYVIDIHQDWTIDNTEENVQGEVWDRLEQDGHNIEQWSITNITLDIENMEAHVDLIEW